MPKTAEQIRQLQANWFADPTWDLEDTEGFETHRAELLAYRLSCQELWARQEAERQAALDAEADRLGARGLYRSLIALQDRVHRLERACFELTEGDHRAAFQALNP